MRRTLPLIIVLASVSCGDDSSPTTPSSSGPAVTFFVTSVTSSTGNLGGLTGADATVSEPRSGGRPWRSDVAGLPQCRARSRQRQSADTREGSHRHRPLVQRQPRARRQQRDGTSRAHRRCRRVRRRARPTHQRAMDRFTIPGPTRHPHRVERRRHRGCRAHVRRLDIDVHHSRRAGWPLRRTRSQSEHDGSPVVVELVARKSELRRHGSARGRGPVLLLRTLTPGMK